MSAKDGNDFDEGSTTITQVQGLRGCRNAGIPVPTEIIDNAKDYIYRCKNPDGGISYSSRNRGIVAPGDHRGGAGRAVQRGRLRRRARPRNARLLQKEPLPHRRCATPTATGTTRICTTPRSSIGKAAASGNEFRDKLYKKIVSEQESDGSWNGNIGPIYVTACNLIMLQLDRAFLPIYQR